MNPSGLPAESSLAALEGLPVARTDEGGAVRVRFEPEGLRVRVRFEPEGLRVRRFG